MHQVPEFITEIEKQLTLPLPGKTAQFEMAAADRPVMHSVPRPDVRTASVLISLFKKEESWHTILIKRTSVRGDRHSGQISFPGGKRENGEPLPYTAIRESHEEVGTQIDCVDILGKLSQLHIPISNFIVHPFVGYLREQPTLSRQEEEVAEIFEVPIHSFTKSSTRKTRDLRAPEGLLLKDVPYFDVHDQTIWGATAMILNEFVQVLHNAERPVSF